MTDQPPPAYPSVDTKTYPPPSAVYPQQQQYAPPPQPYPGPMYQPDPSLPPGAYYTAGGPPGQQQPYVVAQAPQVVVVAAKPSESYCVQIVLSCVVFWCCGCPGLLCGLIAFILGIMANCTAGSNPDSARQLGRASFGVSIAGIVCGVIIFLIVIVIYVMAPEALRADARPCTYPVDNRCFGHRVAAARNGFCSNSSHFYHENYCYFEEH